MTSAIKTPFKTALASAALAACLAAPAHADKTQYIALVLGTGVGNTTQSASFSDLVGYIGSFTDDYVFASPPTLSALTFTGTAGSGITFSSISLLTYGTLASNPLTGTSSGAAFSEITSPSVTSAVYVLEIKGVSASTTASYTGGITNAAPVPEPAGWAMWLLGLGATGAALRRRQGAAT